MTILLSPAVHLTADRNSDPAPVTSPTQSTIASGVVLVIGVAIFLALMLLQSIAERNDPHRCDRALSYMDPGCPRQVAVQD